MPLQAMHLRNESNRIPSQTPYTRVLTAGLLLLACVLTACAWSVPADPGALSRLRGTSWAPATAGAQTQTVAWDDAAVDTGARELYLNHCSRCHAPFAPNTVSAGDWPRYVQRYAPRAGLWGEDRKRVLRWLQANAH